MTFDWPDAVQIRSCEEVSRRQVISSEARNFKAFTADLGYHRWDFRMRCFCAPFHLAEARRFVMAIQKSGNYVYYTDPDWITDTPNRTTNGARNAGDTNVALTSVSGVSPGMFVNFQGHEKLYLIEDIVGNTLFLNCPLTLSLPASSTAIFSAPRVLLELAPELKRSMSIAKNLRRDLTDFNLRFQEAL